MKVTIYTLENGKNTVEGELSLSGSTVVCQPPDNQLLKDILTETIRDPKSKKMVTAKSDPEAWLGALCTHFRSAYLRAGQPVGGSQEKLLPGMKNKGRWVTLTENSNNLGQAVYITSEGKLDPDGPEGPIEPKEPEKEPSKPKPPKIKPKVSIKEPSAPQSSQVEDEDSIDLDEFTPDTVVESKIPEGEVEQFDMDNYMTKIPSWVEELSSGHISLTHDERSAIQLYTGNRYLEMNDALRKCLGDINCLEEGSIKRDTRLIENAILDGDPFPEPVTLFRGIYLNQKLFQQFKDAMTKSMESGEAFQLPSITSTSIDPRIALSFSARIAEDPTAGVTPAVFRIKAKTGMPVSKISGSPTEKEFIKSVTNRYKVIGIKNVKFSSKDPDRVYGYKKPIRVIELEEV